MKKTVIGLLGLSLVVVSSVPVYGMWGRFFKSKPLQLGAGSVLGAGAVMGWHHRKLVGNLLRRDHQYPKYRLKLTGSLPGVQIQSDPYGVILSKPCPFLAEYQIRKRLKKEGKYEEYKEISKKYRELASKNNKGKTK